MSQTDEYMAALICQQMIERRATVFALDKTGSVIEDIVPLFLADDDILRSEVYSMLEQITLAGFDPDVSALAYFWRYDSGGVSVVVSGRDGVVTEQRYRFDPLDALTFDGVHTSDSVIALAVSAATATAFRFANADFGVA